MARHTGLAGPGDGPQHLAPPKGTRRVGRATALAVLVVVVGLTAVGFVVVRGMSGANPDQADAAAPSTTTGTPSPAAAVAAAPSTTATPVLAMLTSPLAAPLGAQLAQSGPGLTEAGILLIAVPAPDGSFDIVERIMLANPVSVLTLRPAPLESAGGQFASASAAATQVQVSAGDRPVVVPGAVVGATIGLAVPEQDHFEIRYRLTDVTIRSTPSTAGRALAAIGPLTGGVDGELPVHFVLAGATVLGLNCPLLPLAQQSCGSRMATGAGVEGQLPSRLAVTTVQFDLPLP